MAAVSHQCVSELLGLDSVPEDLDSIKCDHRNVIFVPRQQMIITLNVYFIEKVISFAVGVLNRGLRLFTEMTAWPGVDDHLSFQWSSFWAVASRTPR